MQCIRHRFAHCILVTGVPEIRQLLYGRRGGVYRVLFTITGRDIRVLHIRHAAREALSAKELSEDF